VLVGVGIALAAGGVFGGEEPQDRAGAPVTEESTVTEQATEETDEPTTDATGPGDPPPDDPPPTLDAQAFEGEAFSTSYPSGWQISQAEELETSPRERTTFTGPGGAEVSIDRVPGDGTSPRANAEKNEASADGDEGYERISFEDVSLQGGAGFKWVFTDGTASKVVYYLTAGGDSYAVLGSGRDFDGALDAARLVADTIEAK